MLNACRTFGWLRALVRRTGGTYNNSLWGISVVVIVVSVIFSVLCFLIYTERERMCCTSGNTKAFAEPAAGGPTDTTAVLAADRAIRAIMVMGPTLGTALFIPILYNILSVFSCIEQRLDPDTLEYAGYEALPSAPWC